MGISDEEASDELYLSARDRYDADLADAVLVGLFLVDDPQVRPYLQRDYARYIPIWRYPHYSLRSLLCSLLAWFAWEDAGLLPPAFPKPDTSDIQNVADYLTVVSMWGEGQNYEEPYTKISGEVSTIELPCWDMMRLAELYALGYRWRLQPVPEVGRVGK